MLVVLRQAHNMHLYTKLLHLHNSNAVHTPLSFEECYHNCWTCNGPNFKGVHINVIVNVIVSRNIMFGTLLLHTLSLCNRKIHHLDKLESEGSTSAALEWNLHAHPISNKMGLLHPDQMRMGIWLGCSQKSEPIFFSCVRFLIFYLI